MTTNQENLWAKIGDLSLLVQSNEFTSMDSEAMSRMRIGQTKLIDLTWRAMFNLYSNTSIRRRLSTYFFIADIVYQSGAENKQ